MSQELETPLGENNQAESLVTGPSKSPKIQPENLDEIERSLREILADLTKSLSENQKRDVKTYSSSCLKTYESSKSRKF